MSHGRLVARDDKPGVALAERPIQQGASACRGSRRRRRSRGRACSRRPPRRRSERRPRSDPYRSGTRPCPYREVDGPGVETFDAWAAVPAFTPGRMSLRDVRLPNPDPLAREVAHLSLGELLLARSAGREDVHERGAGRSHGAARPLRALPARAAEPAGDDRESSAFGRSIPSSPTRETTRVSTSSPSAPIPSRSPPSVPSSRNRRNSSARSWWGVSPLINGTPSASAIASPPDRGIR